MLNFYKQKASELKSSFSSAKGPGRVASRAEALPREFFSSLIQTESDFRSNSYTVETLDTLVQLYARAVEYYDSIQDEISSYFTYKIQDILATKRSLKMLIDRKEQERNSQIDSVDSPAQIAESSGKKPKLKELNINEIRFQTSIQETLVIESSDEEGEEGRGERSRREEWEKKKEAKKQTKSVASLISQKQRFAQFYHRVEIEKDNYKQDMHILFDNYTSSTMENDQTVRASIDAQKQRFRQKLQQRKNNSFLAYTLNNTFNSTNSPNLSEHNYKRGDANEDSILKELDDSKVITEAFTPLIKNRLKSQSLFSKSKVANGFGSGKEEEVQVQVQEKAPECSTPTEKLSTENSLTIEFNLACNEAETSNKEMHKLKA